MDAIGVFIAIVVPIFGSLVAILVALFPSKQSRRLQEKARERRLAEHKMNARLLRLDI